MIRTIVVVSDTHCGCRMGLFPPDGIDLDGGVHVDPSPSQRAVWACWQEFWDDWVPLVTRGEPYLVVMNGDALDGNHHRATTQVSHNLSDQANIAQKALGSFLGRGSRLYWVRGTEAHVGPSGAEEERLAKVLGAVPDAMGDFARWELTIRLAGHPIHFTHHIGSTGSSAYEATAVGKEMVEAYVEAGRWEHPVARVIVRSHRHRYGKWEVYGKKGQHISIVTPAWQLKTPYVYRIAGGRVSPPQIGGIIIRAGDEELYTRAKVWAVEPPEPEVVEAESA